jgi:hypothetical protein
VSETVWVKALGTQSASTSVTVLGTASGTALESRSATASAMELATA